MRFVLQRLPQWPHGQGTPGVLLGPVGTQLCYTLELPWRANQANISCVPPGTYRVKPHSHGRYEGHPALQGVPARAGILFHPGNYAGAESRGWRSDVKGCILPVSHFSKIGDQLVGAGSRQAMKVVQGLGMTELHIAAWGFTPPALSDEETRILRRLVERLGA